MQKVYVLIATGFSAFLAFIIYTANTGNEMPVQQLIRSVDHGDKVAHFILFGALSFLLNLAVTKKCFKWGRWSVYRGTALVAVLAVCEEGSQRFIASRTFDYFDLLADLTGVVLFAFITALFIKTTALFGMLAHAKNQDI